MFLLFFMTTESQFDLDADLSAVESQSTTAGCINKADVEASRGNTHHQGNRQQSV